MLYVGLSLIAPKRHARSQFPHAVHRWAAKDNSNMSSALDTIIDFVGQTERHSLQPTHWGPTEISAAGKSPAGTPISDRHSFLERSARRSPLLQFPADSPGPLPDHGEFVVKDVNLPDAESIVAFLHLIDHGQG